MIGERTINEIGEAVTAILLDHQPDLDRAYAASEDSLTITLGVKVRPVNEGNRCEVKLSFVTSQVKTSVVRIVNEDQASLVFEKIAEGKLPDNFHEGPSLEVTQ
jgi:hypothetical protein